jgi:GTP-binding protein
MSELYAALQPFADAEAGETPALPADSEQVLQMAIVGQPNVGKSTLVNRLLGEDRMVTGLIDTAGLRRQAKIEHKLETLSAEDSFRAIQYAQLVVLAIDASIDIARQDLTIARRVAEEGRPHVRAARHHRAAGGFALPGEGRARGDDLGAHRRGNAAPDAGLLQGV